MKVKFTPINGEFYLFLFLKIMIELKYKRNLNSKHFDLQNGKFVMEAHAGHIHYDNK